MGVSYTSSSSDGWAGFPHYSRHSLWFSGTFGRLRQLSGRWESPRTYNRSPFSLNVSELPGNRTEGYALRDKPDYRAIPASEMGKAVVDGFLELLLARSFRGLH